MANQFKVQEKSISTGDVVKVHLRIVEGDKERLQIFEGTVISIKGSGNNLMFTVRKISSAGIGVERIFPAISPWIAKIEVKKSATQARHAKLYYLREKTRKQTSEITQTLA